MYKSEITNFIEELKQKNPDLEQSQKQGRALLWDKSSINLDDYKRKKEATVAQKAYVYGTE